MLKCDEGPSKHKTDLKVEIYLKKAKAKCIAGFLDLLFTRDQKQRKLFQKNGNVSICFLSQKLKYSNEKVNERAYSTSYVPHRQQVQNRDNSF